MKNIAIIIVIMFVLGSVAAHGQAFQNAVNGQFKLVTMTNGQSGYIFAGQNNTGSILNVIGIAVSPMYNQQRVIFNMLQPGQVFTVGLTDGWTWQNGESFTVIYPDGTRRSWTFSVHAQTLPFNSQIGGPCKFRNERLGCKCNHYVPRGGRWGNPCVCNHSHGAHDAR